MSLTAVAWVVVTLFAATTIGQYTRGSWPVWTGVLGWGGFAVFWLLTIPRFALDMHSVVESVGATLAVIACLWIAYRFQASRAVPLFRLTGAVTVAGVIYLTAATITPVRTTLIETVTTQTHTVLTLAGFDPRLHAAVDPTLVSTLSFQSGEDTYVTHLVFACTGIGAIAAFTGILAVIDATVRQRLAAISVIVPVIWTLNIARNVFIAAAFGHQWFQLFTPTILDVTGYTDPGMVSYIIADRLIAQPVSVLAIVGLCALSLHLLPPLRPMTTALLDSLITSPDRRQSQHHREEGHSGD